jgi:hypothetical protein
MNFLYVRNLLLQLVQAFQIYPVDQPPNKFLCDKQYDSYSTKLNGKEPWLDVVQSDCADPKQKPLWCFGSQTEKRVHERNKQGRTKASVCA